MTDTSPSTPPTDTESVPILQLELGQERISDLLAGLQGSAPAPEWGGLDADPDTNFESHLACVRLGIATSLFYALRTKHAPTAGHCLRVALSCSAWCERMELDQSLCDRIEVAALLHDLGKIGVPDRILRKPGRLTADEHLIMGRYPDIGCDILRGCTSDAELLSTIQYAARWFDSRRGDEGPRADALPLGSRMIAICDAFDSMTTDTVYRSAMSRERALQELFDGSSTQFDPQLSADFSRMLESRPEMLHGGVVNRWLRQLQPAIGDAFWSASLSKAESSILVGTQSSLFYEHLADTIKDGVVFTDSEGTITNWNQVMSQLTGIPASAIVQRILSNDCEWLVDASDSTVAAQSSNNGDMNSLVRECLSSGAVVNRSMKIVQANHEPRPVNVQVSPVHGDAGGLHGTLILVRDLTEKAHLTQQLQTLHKQTTRDPLTGVGNRAHFDAVLAEMSEKAKDDTAQSFSLIICDIDRFKRINDVHGHPAGDEALINFARVLAAHSRDGDLVARYGGEEFLLLAPDCDNATAANRAEAIRAALEATPMSSLAGEFVTASFGVTEFQSGDTPETILARADRALLKAKDNGRNRVIQLGSGNRAETVRQKPKRNWLRWFDGDDSSKQQNEFDIATNVPIDLAIEKLRGFIADHGAEVISVDEAQVSLKINAFYSQGGRRTADQRIAVRADLTLSEQRKHGSDGILLGKTNVHVELQPRAQPGPSEPSLAGLLRRNRRQLEQLRDGQGHDRRRPLGRSQRRNFTLALAHRGKRRGSGEQLHSPAGQIRRFD